MAIGEFDIGTVLWVAAIIVVGIGVVLGKLFTRR